MNVFLPFLAVLLQGEAPRKSEPVYRLPYEAGKSYIMSQGFDKGTHSGDGRFAYDFMMKIGSKICASRAGKVVEVKEDESEGGQDPKYVDKANLVKIDHGDGTAARYAHLQKDGVLVELGDWVEAGDGIALSGATGFVGGPHLHFQVNRRLEPVRMGFEDVPEKEGIPVDFRSYVSKNIPPIPSAQKEELKLQERAGKLAFDLGLYGSSYVRLKKLADAKLKIEYKPQAEAKAKLEEIEKLGDAAAASEDLETLLLGKIRFKGAPAQKKIDARWMELQKTEGFKEREKAAREKVRAAEIYSKGAQSEVDGNLPAALKHYREAAKLAGEYAEKAKARGAEVETKLKAAGAKR